jgi:hypothetical protein
VPSVRQRVCHLLDGAEALAHAIDQLLRRRCIGLRRGKKGHGDMQGLLQSDVDQASRILLVPVAA